MKWPPGKEKGACCSSAPIPELTGLATNNPGHSFTQACRHEVTRVEQMPLGDTHHAKVICVLCGCNLAWLRKCETVRNFLRSVSKNRRLSPKQEALVVRLVRQHLEGAP